MSMLPIEAIDVFVSHLGVRVDWWVGVDMDVGVDVGVSGRVGGVVNYPVVAPGTRGPSPNWAEPFGANWLPVVIEECGAVLPPANGECSKALAVGAGAVEGPLSCD